VTGKPRVIASQTRVWYCVKPNCAIVSTARASVLWSIGKA
jgi:hypothetical protein